VARGAGGQHAVHHLDAHAGVELDLIRVADAHHVAGLVSGQERQHLGDHLHGQLARLAHAQAPDGVAVEVHLDQPRGALAAQIAEGSTLHNSEQALPAAAQLFVPRNLMAVRAEVVERTPRPGHRQAQALFGAAAAGGVLGALVEGHADVGAQRNLHVDGVLGSEKVAAAVQVRTEADALVGDLAQLAQTEDLKAARVGQHGARPTDEAMQPAHAADSLMARPQVEVVGVAEDDLRAQLFEHVLGDGLDGAGRAHRHEDRRLDGAVRQMKLPPPPASRGC